MTTRMINPTLIRHFFWVLLLPLVFSVSSLRAQSSEAETLERLTRFTTELKSFTADFEQTLYGENDEVIQNHRGKIILKRPGKFIWQYEGDAAQEIVSDGANLWLFDKELEQVTVNPLNERVGGTPLVLLMGTASLESEFTVKPLGVSEGIDWVQLVPHNNNTDFEAMFLGLNDKGLAAMELRDNFGQATQIMFDNFKPDVKLNDAQFNFKAPEGVDVVGQRAN